ncbi:MAG: glycosyltransferase family 2 protein [Lentisphaerae bacterium]|nr:glycosyltransferase family 2 protein [Lentisphaerota bacterium]
MLTRPAICITTYRREKYLDYLLSKLCMQTFNNFIIIITDNANESSILELIKGYEKLNIAYFKETRQGVCYARNKCLEEFLRTNSDCLVWIDDDEFPMNRYWLEELIKVQDQTGAYVVGGDVLTEPVDDTQQYLKKALYKKSMAARDGESLRYFYTNNTLIVKEVIEKVGFFDLAFNLSGSEDLDFAIRAKQLGFQAVYSQKAKVMEFHPKEKSTTRWFLLRGIRIGEGFTLANIKSYGVAMSAGYSILLSGYRIMVSLYLHIVALLKQDRGCFLNAALRFGTAIGALSALCGHKYKEYKNH